MSSIMTSLYGHVPMVVDLKKYKPMGKNRIAKRLDDGFSTTSLYDVVKWDDKGIEIFRYEEGCFHANRPLGPYIYSWKQLEKLAEAGESGQQDKVHISKERLDGLLKLRK